jgi:hypothetical protein
MTFQIDNIPVAFDMATFESLCKEEKVTWTLSSLKDLRSLLGKKPAPSGAQVLTEIRKIPRDKRAKYKAAIKYVLFSWPDVVGATNAVADGRLLDRLDFQGMFATMDTTTDFVDLQYGISGARGMQPYKLTDGRVRFADDFNNSSNLGTGDAFKRNWQGYGFLGATPDSVTERFRKGEKLDDKGRTRGILPPTRQAYVNSMLASRYSPTRSLGETSKKLSKDTQKSLDAMTGIHGKKEAKSHYWMHAAFVKAVRRACKGGIAMVASHPGYTSVYAKVHFVLDGLGDLGRMARKDKLPPDKGGYLAITSSELCFCCRYWDDPEYPLGDIIKFYVNGTRVMPPWLADWSLVDAAGANVVSNQEAWLRFKLAHDLLSDAKVFPRMLGDVVDPTEA